MKVSYSGENTVNNHFYLSKNTVQNDRGSSLKGLLVVFIKSVFESHNYYLNDS